ncbi:MAG: hypothetical protein F6K23_02905 [Okeania sp. SIO2C9]|uniref:hypothetical protein n=1 Tax=Okeania sp. SIO2C9 TaxID=2607791 RepID=UPI0013C1F5FE|nr:hypothetical protein [Okeania sp. SIO2C9]NEQ72116.1 hypothetical protein [Okeania sp. SIO2C9]
MHKCAWDFNSFVEWASCLFLNIKSGSIGVIRWKDGEMEGWGDGDIEKYLVMVEYGTFFYTELN